MELLFSILRAVLDMYVAVLNILENNYPETLQASYIVNCKLKLILLIYIHIYFKLYMYIFVDVNVS